MPLSKWPGWDPLPEAQPSKNYFFVISTPCCIILDGSRIFLFLTPPPTFFEKRIDHFFLYILLEFMEQIAESVLC